MGQAKLRGTFEERKAQAIAAGRSHAKVKDQREAAKMAKYRQKELAILASMHSFRFFTL